jgi:ABC-type transporter Mla subunit MlaD
MFDMSRGRGGDRPSWAEVEILRTQDEHSNLFQQILQQLSKLQEGVTKIMSEQDDAAAELAGFKDQLIKANAEIQAKIQALIDAANQAPAGTLQPNLKAAIEDLKPVAQALDDIVPDQPPTT